MSGVEKRDLVFFLGGHDLEMATVRELLERHAPGRFHDRGLRWGAKTSAYRAEIEACLERGQTPVVIELEDDLGLDRDRVIKVDHHGEEAGAAAATALQQVFALLGLAQGQWNRWLELVAANDRAYLRGLGEIGASAEEVRRVREADRAAQGITAREEEQAAAAAGNFEVRCGGRLQVARLPHSRTAALVDRLQPELGGPGFENLVVLSPEEVNVFGAGEVIQALTAAFPSGWYGGALPAYGYWGHAGAGEEVVRFLERYLGDG
jgi:hypothetical protein